MKDPPAGLYAAFGHVPAHKAVLCATDHPPFSARKYLAAHADIFTATKRFERSIYGLLALIGHPEIIHAHAYRAVKVGARLYHVPGLLATHRRLFASHALELLIREEHEPTGIFSSTHPNYVRIGTYTWLKIHREQGRWVLDARTRAELDEEIPLGSHIIVRN